MKSGKRAGRRRHTPILDDDGRLVTDEPSLEIVRAFCGLPVDRD